jgi:PqqD family protein of HPr-rel-A system
MPDEGVDPKDGRLRRKPDLQARLVDDEMVVLDLASGQVHHLNGTAGYIWSRFDGAASLAQIAESVAEQFDVDPRVAERDVNELAHRFTEIGLLVAEATVDG